MQTVTTPQQSSPSTLAVACGPAPAWRSSFLPPMHIASPLSTVASNPFNILNPQVCSLISCNVLICLQILNSPSIRGTDQVCLWLLFVNLNKSGFISLSVCFPPFPSPSYWKKWKFSHPIYSYQFVPLNSFVLIITPLSICLSDLSVKGADTCLLHMLTV